MKTIQVELPNKAAEELSAIVKSGWFNSEDEVIRMALAEFISRHRFALLEKFQLEDIAWALKQKDSLQSGG